MTATKNELKIERRPTGDVFEDTALQLHVVDPPSGTWDYQWTVEDDQGNQPEPKITGRGPVVKWKGRHVGAGTYTFKVEATTNDGPTYQGHATVEIKAVTPVRVVGAPWSDGVLQPVDVNLQRAAVPDTTDLPLWEVIKLGTEAISFDNYAAWMDFLFCGADVPASFHPDRDRSNALPSDGLGRKWLSRRKSFGSLEDAEAPLPFPDIEGYKVLRAATETFLELNAGVVFDKPVFPTVRSLTPSERDRLGLESGDTLRALWNKYVVAVNGTVTIPYLHRVRQKLGNVELTTDRAEGELCDKILEEKFTSPFALELIWSYWMEEGMLVQTMNAISMRFQNRRGPAEIDPLSNLAIDPLRPLGNLLWGYIQDEQHRLTVARRAYEYDHEYGLALLGQAVPPVRGADTRSSFLPAFHNLLHRASIFYKEDDDTTMIADAFPVLNAIREVNLLLAEGAHNAYRDLPWTARIEMLMQQWLLARPEFREFLPTRVMVVYPEPWMDRVDAMKKLQGWGDTSIRYFRDLAVFGEQIVLSLRFGDWQSVTDREQAANWARVWRQELQWYIHAYQAVTGVDLSADMADVRQAEQAQARALPPAFHLQRRLVEQRRAAGIAVRQPAPAPYAVAPPSGQPVV